MAAFVQDSGTGAIPHIVDLDGTLWERFGVGQQRTYVFLDDDGSSRVGGYGNLSGDVEDLIGS